MADDKTFTQADLDAAVAKATGDVQGLKDKIDELIGDNKKLKADLRAANGIKPEDMAAIEAELSDVKAKLSAAEKGARDSAKARETAEASLKGEQLVTHKLLVENGLREQLVVNGVTHAVHQKAAMALLASQVKIEADGENRVAKVGDKALGDFVKEWAGSDEGKHFVAAPGNGGGGAGGGSGKSSAKQITRAAFNEMAPAEQMAFSKDGGTVVDAAS